MHLTTEWKFDLFPLQRDEYSRTEFGRRSYRQIRPDGTEPIECLVASAEDTVLRKLEWYRKGSETSDRQWNDLRGLVATARLQLDLKYLRHWSAYLKITDLLEKLLAERKI